MTKADDAHRLFLKRFTCSAAVFSTFSEEMGLDPAVLAELMVSMPKQQFDTIKWVLPQSWDAFRRDMDIIMHDMIRGENNSLIQK